MAEFWPRIIFGYTDPELNGYLFADDGKKQASQFAAK